MCTSCAQLNSKRPSGMILHRNHPSEHRLYNQLTTLNTGVWPRKEKRLAICVMQKGWLAIAKLKPLSLFISLLLMPNKTFDC